MLSNFKIFRVLSLLYLPAVNMGLLLAPVTLSYDWQTGSVPAIITFSDGRNFASLFFYVSVVVVVCVGLVRANVIIIDLLYFLQFAFFSPVISIFSYCCNLTRLVDSFCRSN